MRDAEISEEALTAVAGVDDDWARLETRALCDEIVRSLQPRDQLVLRLHFVDALSHPEAGARLGISARRARDSCTAR